MPQRVQLPPQTQTGRRERQNTPHDTIYNARESDTEAAEAVQISPLKNAQNSPLIFWHFAILQLVPQFGKIGADKESTNHHGQPHRGQKGRREMKVTHITTHSVNEAWSKANEIFPTDYEIDSRASKNAGYDIWWSTRPGCAAWISDLGNRLEVNLENGDTVNVWIEEEEEQTTESESTEQTMSSEEVAQMVEATKTAEQMTVNALFTPEVCQMVTLCIDGDYGTADERVVFDAIRAGHPSILFDLLTRYAETHGIKWGGIWGCEARHYDHGSGKRGHYIVSGYISGRIGEEIDFCANCADILRQAAENHKNI